MMLLVRIAPGSVWGLRAAWVVAALLLCTNAGLPSRARAQTEPRTINLALGLGSGYERGAGYSLLDGRRSPVFVEAAIRTYDEEDPVLVLGGSLRFELEQSMGLAFVPRAELRYPGSFLELRPGIAVPVFVSPELMLGPEISLTARMGGRRGMGFFVMGSLAAFIVGGDVPEDSTVMMLNLQLGIDLQL
jgi:hypothetical protein